jgi:hypothetical protein
MYVEALLLNPQPMLPISSLHVDVGIALFKTVMVSLTAHVATNVKLASRWYLPSFEPSEWGLSVSYY